MAEFTQADIVDKVRELAEQNPNKTYEAPETYDYEGSANYNDDVKYLHGSEPGCIFGHALVALNVPDSLIEMYEGDLIRNILVAEAAGDYAESISEWCVEVQELQDQGEPWGAAVAFADDRWFEEGLGIAEEPH